MSGVQTKMSDISCALCSAPSTILCSDCGNAHYCSKDHQMTDYAHHQEKCQYYKVENTEQFGQHLVASRDISAGTVIFVDRPLVVGPSSWTKLVCLGCHNYIDEAAAHSCSKCLWPLCSEKCENSEIHKSECEILSKDSTENRKGHPRNLQAESPLYDMIIVIRSLLLRSQNPQGWKLLLSMISHSEKREANKNDPQHKAIVEFIKRYLVNDDYERKEISHVRGVIFSNAMGINNGSGVRLRALYPIHRLINHSCIPNLHLITNGDGTMQVRAAVDIKANEMLTDSYTGTMEPYCHRYLMLTENYFFTCECALCKDPTEFGTFYSSSRCFSCPSQYMCPNVSDGRLNFVCNKCNAKKDVLDTKLDTYEWEARSSKQDMFGQSSPREVEIELNRLETEFHPTHYIWYKVARAALHSLLENNSIKSIDLRYKLWKKELECLNILDPGLTRRKGSTLLELGYVEFLYAKESMLEENAFPPFFTGNLQDAIIHLQDGISYLELEPPGSNMIKIVHKAKDQLAEAMKLLKSISSQEEAPMLPTTKLGYKEQILAFSPPAQSLIDQF